MPPRLAPTRSVAQLTRHPEATIRSWARRGRITQYGTSRRRLYDIDEVTACSTRARRDA